MQTQGGIVIMTIQTDLQDTIEQLVVRGKGILAADESLKTLTKRFAALNIDCSENNRRDYREMLFTAENLNNYISGVILFEETLGQKASTGETLGNVLADRGIVPGIKVDKGLIDLPETAQEKVTQGLDGLLERLKAYKELGARFAKWRAVYNIGERKPSFKAIEANAHGLARYASLCQSVGIVPIVEPEILMEGNHDLNACAQVTEWVLQNVFQQLYHQGVTLETMILKPSMVTPGEESHEKASIEQVARATVDVLRRRVPAAVPSINFLSGGQSAEDSTAHLNAMNVLLPTAPWNLSFSYGRALQQPSLLAWHGDNKNKIEAQKLLCKRSRLNSAASLGEYNASME